MTDDDLCGWEPCLDCADEVNRLLGKLASRDEDVRRLTIERDVAVKRAETAEAALIQAQAEFDEDSGAQWARADAAEAEAARQRTRAERAERERDEAHDRTDLLSELRALVERWPTENGDYPESKRDCADELSAILAKYEAQAEPSELERALASQVESMAMRIESLAEELAKPEDVRLREVLDALEGRAVIFDGLGARVGHLLAELDEWIGRAGEAERLADERLAHAHQLQADIEAEQQGRLALRKRLGAREDETMGAFLERLATMAGAVPADVHDRGWQWRPTATDTAFAPPFGTIRQCRVCGCLVAGGPTACVRCAEEQGGTDG